MQTSKSTFYNSLLGGSKDKFDHARHKRNNSITENNFFKWSNGHAYRTSYGDMAHRFNSVERKNAVIPGYAGYRPKIKADSCLQKTFTEQSRDVYKKERLDDNVQYISSTGLNKALIPRDDATLNATSRRYGTETMPWTHPHNHNNYAPNETTMRASYVSPKV